MHSFARVESRSTRRVSGRLCFLPEADQELVNVVALSTAGKEGENKRNFNLDIQWVLAAIHSSFISSQKEQVLPGEPGDE